MEMRLMVYVGGMSRSAGGGETETAGFLSYDTDTAVEWISLFRDKIRNKLREQKEENENKNGR
jgi:hypothetical protein